MSKHKALIILELDVADQREFNEAIEQILAMKLPFYAGQVHIAIEEMADKIRTLLEEDSENA